MFHTLNITIKFQEISKEFKNNLKSVISMYLFIGFQLFIRNFDFD